jgi:hypothetical protein
LASAWELRSEWLYIMSLSGSAWEQPWGCRRPSHEQTKPKFKVVHDRLRYRSELATGVLLIFLLL